MSHHKNAIVIGAGIAGIASAIRLAVQGFKVEVYEKNAYAGGKLSHMEKDGYRFDAGPSLFTQPKHIEDLFQLAGEPITPYFTYHQMDESCRYFYEDGTTVRAYTNQQQFANELHEKLGESADNVINYLKQSEKAYQVIGSIFLNHSLHKRSTLVKAPIFKAVSATKKAYLFKTLHQVNTKSFTQHKTVQLFNRYATYNGSNPYQAPGMLSLIPHIEHNEGVYYPKGGMIAITNALYQLAEKKGVHFYFNSPVTNIIHHEDKVIGVVVNQQNHVADVVVSNIDVYFTYQHLLKDHRKAKQILKQERSSSAVIFYWGITKEFPQLGLHNILFAKDYNAEFNALFKLKTGYADPTIYINITSKCEPGIHSPEGTENWFVMVNAPANVGQHWEAFINEYRKAIIHKINCFLGTDISSLIATELILDPVTIEANTASYMGSLYGTSSNSRFAAFLRHPNFNNAIKGLYFVGGSVHPGGGLPLCLQSAKIMSEMVEKDMAKQRKQPH